VARKPRSDKPTGPVIIIDTREQTPWRFPGSVSVGLKTGDYSVVGMEDIAVIERKSLDDLVQSITWERERFERELTRMMQIRWRAVVVEAGLPDVVEWRYKSMARPESVVGSVIALSLDYLTPFIFCGNRQCAAAYALRWLRKAWERHNAQAK